MTPSIALFLCLAVASTIAAGSTSDGCFVAPSYGDVQLKGDLVLIYVGPDGTDYDHMWRTLSVKREHVNLGDTLCRQMGYEKGILNFYEGENSTNRAVGFLSGNCPNHTKHILRCNLDSNVGQTDHTSDAHLICLETSTRDPYKDLNTYIGQAALLPPEAALNCNRSRSYGVVTVKAAIKQGWNYLYHSTPRSLSQSTTDTICREMGYTHSVQNSLWTTREYNIALNNHTFDYYTNQELKHYTGINSTRFSCSSSNPCITCSSCHFPDESVSKYNVYKTLSQKPGQNDAIMIRCSFYRTEHVPSGGTEDMCKGDFGSKDCSLSTDVCLSKGKFAGVIIAALLLGTIAVLLINLAIICFKCRQRRRYNRLQEDNREGGADHDHGAGNGNIQHGNGAENGGNGDGGEDGNE